jgi:hypothetical protein
VRSFALRACGVALGAALAVLACGPEDIELAHGDAAKDASVDGDDQATGRLLPTDGSAPLCDSAAPPPACRGLGAACGSASDCCSAHCASGACVPPGSCSGANAPCTTRSDCCSGLCEPLNGTTARACLAECLADGTPCDRASDCCSLDCNTGACGGDECLQVGSDCASDAQCCSNVCDASQGGKCALDPVATCRPSGENCTAGGGSPCCGACDDTTKRCDPGPGPCRALGAVCEQATDCCHGTCDPDATGRTVCTAPPLPDGTGCQAGFECATMSCTGNPPTCGPAAAACVPSGAPCAAGTPCCSGSCNAGTCEAGCIPSTR